MLAASRVTCRAIFLIGPRMDAQNPSSQKAPLPIRLPLTLVNHLSCVYTTSMRNFDACSFLRGKRRFGPLVARLPIQGLHPFCELFPAYVAFVTIALFS